LTSTNEVPYMAKFVTLLNCNITVMYNLYVNRTVRTVYSAFHVSCFRSSILLNSFNFKTISSVPCVCSDCFIFGSWVRSLTQIEKKKPYTLLACIITVNSARQRSKKINHTLLMVLPLQADFIGVHDHWL
jgi:hypothetical protein